MKESHNIVKETALRYSVLWDTYKNIEPPETYHFSLMQEVIPEKIIRGKRGLEIGCGCGWDTALMARSNLGVMIVGMDISSGVYITSKFCRDLKNVKVIGGSASEIPLKDETFDFIYSFGVLHHIKDYKKGFNEISRVLKNGAPCFLYLYEDHSHNLFKYFAIKVIGIIRKVTVRMPARALYLVSCCMSPFVFLVFALPAKILKKFKFTYGLYEKMPFNFGTSLFSLKGDIYDRFSVPVERRFNRNQLIRLLEENNFYNNRITRLKAIAGWVVWGYKGETHK